MTAVTRPSLTRSTFGAMPDGRNVSAFALDSGAGVRVTVIAYGAILTELHAPDRRGVPADIVLGVPTLADYLAGHPHFGATVGRYANRIAGGRFTLDGAAYTLAANNGPNALHGGLEGFDKKVWDAEPGLTGNCAEVRFRLFSPAMDEGYPGGLHVTAAYRLTRLNELWLEYTARADAPTVVNLTNHTYFNLSGGSDILGHTLALAADHYTPVDTALIPTGAIAPVAGTPFDFTTPHPIGERIGQVGGEPSGYDHNFVLRQAGGLSVPAARVHDPETGRVLELFTSQPGVQFYTGNFLDGSLAGKQGRRYGKHAGFCLETQHFPDSPNQPSFPSTVLRPGQTYREVTVWRFGAD